MKRTGINPGSLSLERGSTFSTPRSELKKTATKTKRRAISPASPEQRAKVREQVSIVSGESPCDPCHVWPRGMGGCDHPDCVIPLTRSEHQAFDEGRLDVLPFLVAHGMWAELAHPISEHRVDPVSLLQRLTGVRWVGERDAA